MATHFVRPETIPYYIETLSETKISIPETISKLDSFHINDKLINYQLNQLKLNLEYYEENDLTALSIVDLETVEKPKKKKKGGSKWN